MVHPGKTLFWYLLEYITKKATFLASHPHVHWPSATLGHRVSPTSGACWAVRDWASALWGRAHVARRDSLVSYAWCLQEIDHQTTKLQKHNKEIQFVEFQLSLSMNGISIYHDLSIHPSIHLSIHPSINVHIHVHIRRPQPSAGQATLGSRLPLNPPGALSCLWTLHGAVGGLQKATLGSRLPLNPSRRPELPLNPSWRPWRPSSMSFGHLPGAFLAIFALFWRFSSGFRKQR